jgi:hypothetical protein
LGSAAQFSDNTHAVAILARVFLASESFACSDAPKRRPKDQACNNGPLLDGEGSNSFLVLTTRIIL